MPLVHNTRFPLEMCSLPSKAQITYDDPYIIRVIFSDLLKATPETAV